MSGIFDNKVVVVTGGSRGIGRAIVARFSSLGAKVYFTFRQNNEAAGEVAQEYGATPIQCSQADGEQIERTLERILKESGSIDILINNAGLTSDQFVMLMSYEDWDKVIDTNTGGAFRWAKAVSRPMMSARRGVIVNIASVSGLVGIAGQTSYAASKGAMLAFTRALAAELGPRGIRVNAVVPGFIETDMTAKMPRQIKTSNLERILLRRFGKAEEVANVVSFLSSEEASYIAGQSIVVDGGLTGTVT